MKKPRPSTLLLLGAVLLVVGVGCQVAQKPAALNPAEAKSMTQPQDVQLQQWVDPATGERVNLSFDGQKAVLERGGKISVHENPPFDEAAELARAQRDMDDSMLAFTLQNTVQSGLLDDPQGRKMAVEEQGMPPELWDGLINWNAMRQKDAPWQDPPPALLKLYGTWMRQRVTVAPPPATTSFDEQAQMLREAGLLRLTPHRPDGALWLPPVLEPHRAALQATEKPVLRLVAQSQRQPKLWESKVGGVPYRKRGAAWPMSREAQPRPLVFLAQLNMAELNPQGKNLPDFPDHGLLQFFILNTELYGAEMDRRPDEDLGFRVLYLPEVVQDESQLEAGVVEPLGDQFELEDGLPFNYRKTVALSAFADRAPVGSSDQAQFAMLGLPKNYWEDETASRASEALFRLLPDGHKLGGYPDFTQADPRPHWGGDWQLLFQLDSDSRLGLMWGDMGIGNFFIHPDDLRRRDFSRVAYHWDCG